MTLDEYAKEQLIQAYSRIAADKESSARIKNWCVTVWVGSLAAASSSRLLLLGIIQRFTLPLLPIAFFWLLDAIEHVYIALHVGHAKKLEGYLLGLQRADANELRHLSLESGYQMGTLSQKLQKLLQHAFTTKPVVIFYVMLSLVTLLFSLLLKYGLVQQSTP